MTAALTRADALRLPLADDSVDLVVTSPPFLNLRSYRDNGEHYEGQLGSETTQEAFLENLWTVAAECARVLKPTGSMFFELGDSYADKSLRMSPARFAIGCIDRLGLTLRAEVVWNRPNGLPESVTDRVRRSHSCWFHLTKAPRYFAAMDEVRTPQVSTIQVTKAGASVHRSVGRQGVADARDATKPTMAVMDAPNPLGALPGSVWSVPSEPLRVPDHLPQHFAAFPTEWPRRLILGWSPSGICVECGDGRRPVVEQGDYESTEPGGTPRYLSGNVRPKPHDNGKPGSTLGYRREATIVGYACACTPYTDHAGTGDSPIPSGTATAGRHRTPTMAQFADAPRGGRVGPWREYHLDGWVPPSTRPAVVLDPFCGTGTTVLVARALGRFGVGVDLSSDYLRLARWRIWESGDAAKAIRRTNLERQGNLLTQPDAYRPTDVVETGGLL